MINTETLRSGASDNNIPSKMQFLYQQGFDFKELRQVHGYPFYFAGDDGQIYSSISGKLKKLKPRINNRGYYQLTLVKDGNKKTKRKSRLVAEAFIPNPENKPEVNHKDLDKLNDKPNNLEWNTRLENQQHAARNGAFPIDKGFTRKPVNQIHMCAVINTFKSIAEAGRKTLIPFSNIAACARGEYEQAGGYKWEYANE